MDKARAVIIRPEVPTARVVEEDKPPTKEKTPTAKILYEDEDTIATWTHPDVTMIGGVLTVRGTGSKPVYAFQPIDWQNGIMLD